MVKMYVSTVSRRPTSYTHNDYSLIPQIPPLTFMAAIFCVITSSPPKMKSHSRRIELPGWTALVCGHVCVFRVRLCALVYIGGVVVVGMCVCVCV